MKLKKNMSKREWVFVGIIAVLTIALAVGGFFAFRKIKAKEDKSYYDKKCEAYFLENQNYAKGQIVFIGDSITDLYVLDDYYLDYD